ncbi:MAG: hypothetical protein GY696_01925 [Gammaproteobacteria bacterium]|nr:hypothetical protein [Gammaproteobacteria bacterium]
MTSPESELTLHNFQISDGTAWCPMKFMVDSGATISPMSGDSCDRWFSRITVHPLDKKVFDVDRRLVKDIRGFFQTKINFGARVHLDRFYVSESGDQDLLEGNFLTPFQVSIHCGSDSVSASLSGLSSLIEEFPNLVSDKFEEFQGPSHSIKVDAVARPAAVRL